MGTALSLPYRWRRVVQAGAGPSWGLIIVLWEGRSSISHALSTCGALQEDGTQAARAAHSVFIVLRFPNPRSSRSPPELGHSLAHR